MKIVLVGDFLFHRICLDDISSSRSKRTVLCIFDCFGKYAIIFGKPIDLRNTSKVSCKLDVSFSCCVLLPYF